MILPVLLALAPAILDWHGISYSNGQVYVTVERRGAKRIYSLRPRRSDFVLARVGHPESLRLVRRATKNPNLEWGKGESITLPTAPTRPAVRLRYKRNFVDRTGFRWTTASIVGTNTGGRWQDVLTMEGDPYRIIQNATGKCTVCATDSGAEISIWDTSQPKLVRNTQGIYLRDISWIPNSEKAVIVGGKNATFLGVINLRTGVYRELASFEPGWYSGVIAYDHAHDRMLLLTCRTRVKDPTTYYEEWDMNGKFLKRTKIVVGRM